VYLFLCIRVWIKYVLGREYVRGWFRTSRGWGGGRTYHAGSLQGFTGQRGLEEVDIQDQPTGTSDLQPPSCWTQSSHPSCQKKGRN
jgi:hypothetical protein